MIKSLLLLGAMLGSPMMLNGAENSSEPQSSEVVSSETSNEGGKALEDKDGNGIPDALEDFYNDKIRDKYLFGISLGSIIGAATSLLGILIVIIRNEKTNKKLIKENALAMSWVAELEDKQKKLQELFEEYHCELKEALGKDAESILALREFSEANLKEFRDSSELLKQYAQFERKLTAVLNSLKEMSMSPEMVKLGIAEKVNSIIKEVK